MAVDVGSAVGYLDLDISGFLNGLKSAQNEAEQTSTSITDKLDAVGNKLSSVGKKATALVTTPIVGAGTAIVKTTANFEASMSKVSAISGATGDDLTALSDKAKEMGETTKFSASESAEALQYMAMAGWKTEDMLGGLEGIMNLAAASGEDLASTSDIVTDALTAFGLSASDSGHFADVLATASSNANTNVSMLGESFKYVAPLAGSLGYSVEDVGVALGLMANAGIKAGQAGTSLRSAISGMISPSKDAAGWMSKLGISVTNDDGSMKSLAEVMDMLREKMVPLTEEQIALNYQMAQTPENMGALMDGWSELTDEEKKYRTEVSQGIDILEAMSAEELKEAAQEQLGIKLTKERRLTEEEYYQMAQSLGMSALNGLSESEQAMAASSIFGERAMSGMLAIVNAAPEDYEKLTEAINDADGTAKDMADTMNDNLSGQLTLLKSQIEGVAIKLGNILVPIIKKVVDKISQAVDWFSNLSEEQQKTILKIAGIAAAIGPLLLIIGKVITTISTVIKIINAVKTAMIAVNAVMMANPIFLIVAAIAALIAIFVLLWNKCEGFRNFFKGMWEEIKKTTEKYIGAVVDFFKKAWETIKAIFSPIVDWFKEKFEMAWLAIKIIWEAVSEFFQGIWDGIKSIFEPVIDWFSEKFEAAWTAIKTIWLAVHAFFQVIWDGIKAIFEPVINWFKEKFEEAWLKIKLVWSVVSSFFKEIWEAIKNVFSKVGGWFKDKFQEAVDNVKAVFSIISHFFSEIWEGIKGVFSKVGTWFKDKFQEALDNIKAVFSGIKEFFSGIWDKIKDVFGSVGKKIGETFSNAFKSVVNNIFEFIENKINGFIDMINGVIDFINNIPGVELGHLGYVELPRLAKGGLAYGPTAAIVGDNPNARQDPEVISPLSKLKEMFVEVVEKPLNKLITLQEQMNNQMASVMQTKIIDITPMVMLLEELVNISKINYSYNLSKVEKFKQQESENDRNGSISGGGDTYNFYTNNQIDEEEAARQIKRVKRDIAEGF